MTVKSITFLHPSGLSPKIIYIFSYLNKSLLGLLEQFLDRTDFFTFESDGGTHVEKRGSMFNSWEKYQLNTQSI